MNAWMIKSMDSFLKLWDDLFFPSLIMGLVGVRLLVLAILNNKKNEVKKSLLPGILLILQVGIVWSVDFILMEKIQTLVRQEVSTFVQTTNGIQVSVNEIMANQSDNEQLVKSLGALKFVPSHYSYTTDKFELMVIAPSGTIKLNLERDSQIKNEFWVFFDKYWLTTTHEIGRITSDELR